MSKAISLENLKTFKQECDKAYASKEEIITATVDCSHKYEITGNTGDEHGLAIDDQQMLIKKIQGHSRRKSLNLYKPDPFTESQLGVIITFKDGIFNLNGTSSSNNYKAFYSKVEVSQQTTFSFTCSSLKQGSDTWQFYIQGIDNSFAKYQLGDNGQVSTFTLEKGTYHVALSLYANQTFNNLKLYPMLVEGTFNNDTMPPFQPYDNTLVNSNNQLISTGRNLVDVRIPTINSSEWKNLGTTTLLKGRYFIKVESDTNEGACVMNIGSFEVYPSGMRYNTSYWFDVPAQGAQGQIQFYSNTANTNVKVQIRYVPTGNVNFDFEPYKQDVVQAPMLGEFDYYQEGKIYRQTSQVVNIDGVNTKIYAVSQNENGSYRASIKLNKPASGNSTDISNNKLEVNSFDLIYKGSKKGVCLYSNHTLVISIDGLNTVDEYNNYLKSNPIQLVYKLATPTIEDYVMPSGYAVYNGGMQIQQGDVPYTITKQYNLSQKAQILANIEVDREQAKMIDENNQKFNLIPKFSHVDINQPSTATNGTLTQEQLTTLQINDLNYIIFNNEIYSLNDKTHTADTLTYSHVGFENGKHLLKTISITVSTRAWVLNTTSVVDSYEYRMFKINKPSGNISTSIKEIYIYTNKFDTASRFQDFLQNAYDGDMFFAFSCVAITPTDTIINAQFFYDLNIDPSSYFVIFNDKSEYVEHQNLVVVESA